MKNNAYKFTKGDLKIMKRTMKWLVLALVLALALSAAACGHKADTSGDDGTLGNAVGGNESGNVLENGTLSEDETALVDFYFGVIKDLYEEDHGLNDNVEVIAVDLSNVENLSEDGKTVLLEKVAEEYSAESREASYQELVSEGAISNPEEFPSFDNGLLFSFTDFEATGDTIKFDAEKWRTALGAYFFVDCTAEKGDDGTWTYEVGGYAIS